MKGMRSGLGAMVVAMGTVAWSQTTAPVGAQLLASDEIAAKGRAVLAEAQKSASGTAGVTLAKYDGHYTMLTARTKSGGAEVHERWSDFLIVVDGEGSELTGGTVVDAKPGSDGETRGARLEGAITHPLHKGDVIHIPAGTPHQAIEAPGQTITIFVIKVAVPKT